MTTYYGFDRQILAKTETTEGTVISMSGTNYIDTQADIELTLDPTINERPLVRPGFTTVPDLHSSVGIGAGEMVGTGTITMTVEWSMKTGSTPVTTAPAFDPLLKACGFEAVTAIKRNAIGAITGGPYLNRESIQVAAADGGLALGTTFTGDTYLYYEENGGIGNAVSADGLVSGAAATTSSVAVDVGIAYCLNTTKGNGDGSSCSISLYRAGRLVTLKGCRGNVAFEFVSRNRVLMTFTMQGVMSSVANGSKTAAIAIGHAVPGTFNDATLSLAEHTGSAFTSALFETLTLDLGNTIALRSDANSAAGFKAAQIVGRAPTLTVNPDAVLGGTTSSTAFDFYRCWVEGTSVRAEWKIGDGMDGQSALFRAPALQIDGVAPGDRDEVETYEVTCSLTGGLYGDSVEPTTPTTRWYDDRGYDNELTIILF